MIDLKTIKALILDMDGVLWRESVPIGDLPDIFSRIQQLGLKVILATNNATRTSQQFVEKMAGFGVRVSPDQVVNSSMALAYLLRKKHPAGGPVYVVGENSLINTLAEAGFFLSDAPGLAVIGSMDRQISFEKLRRATLLIRSGVPFYGTNPDRTYPTPEGLIPGAGSILGALEVATDVTPIIVGKPNTTIFDFALERLGTNKEETLIVGDRLETDILGGQRAGCPTALVLSGIATRAEAEAYTPSVDIFTEDLGTLVNLLHASRT